MAGIDLVKHFGEFATIPLENVSIHHPTYKWITINAGPLGIFRELQTKKTDAAFQRSVDAGAEVETKTVSCQRADPLACLMLAAVVSLTSPAASVVRCRSSCTAP